MPTNSWDWARPKPGVGNSNQVSHVDGMDPSTWTISCCFQECALAGSWDTEQSWDSHAGSSLWVEDILRGILTTFPKAHHHLLMNSIIFDRLLVWEYGTSFIVYLFLETFKIDWGMCSPSNTHHVCPNRYVMGRSHFSFCLWIWKA